MSNTERKRETERGRERQRERQRETERDPERKRRRDIEREKERERERVKFCLGDRMTMCVYLFTSEIETNTMHRGFIFIISETLMNITIMQRKIIHILHS